MTPPAAGWGARAEPESYQIARPRAMKKKTAAFSLIELLIVIAIIGILAGLVVVSISSIRNSAREKHCTNNLKQLLDGALAYAMDNNQEMPYAQSYERYDENTGVYYHYYGWCTWVNDKLDFDKMEELWQKDSKTSHSPDLYDDRGMGAAARFAVEYGTLFPYIGDFSTYACPVIQHAYVPPTDWEDEDGDKVRDSGIVRTYAMNPYFGAASRRHWRHVKTTWIGSTESYGGHVPEASKLVVFAEVDGYGDKQGRGSFESKAYGKDFRGGCCLNPEKSVVSGDTDQYLACWHGRLSPTEENREKSPGEFFAQAIFFDGHVERLPRTVSTSSGDSGSGKQLNVAWLVTRGWDWKAERSKAPDEK